MWSIKQRYIHDFQLRLCSFAQVALTQDLHFQENDWVYVISEENQEGFIPHSYCAQVTIL